MKFEVLIDILLNKIYFELIILHKINILFIFAKIWKFIEKYKIKISLQNSRII